MKTKATDEVIALVENALCQRVNKCDIKRLLKAKYGIAPRTAEYALARARDRIKLRTQLSTAEHRTNSLAFYDAILRNAQATIREKILAQERIDFLLGLNAPDRQEITGPGGGPLQSQDVPMPFSNEHAAQVYRDAIREEVLSELKEPAPEPASPSV